MNGFLASAAALGPPLALLAIGIALLVVLGPTDWSLVRPRWEPSWPRGVQEEDPREWDFSHLGASDAAPPDEPPVSLARVRASRPGPSRPRRT
jgi:hypothetical protein